MTKVHTFPIEIKFESFNTVQPYLEDGVRFVKGNIATVIEYDKDQLGLVMCIDMKVNQFREESNLEFFAIYKAKKIPLMLVATCHRTNLYILKPTNAQDAAYFKDKKIPLAEKFSIKNEAKISCYQKDLECFKDIVTATKAKLFRFGENYFEFSLLQKLNDNKSLSNPGPVMNKSGQLIGYMYNNESVISAFHIKYLLDQLKNPNFKVNSSYPIINLNLKNLDSLNYHLYLPKDAFSEENLYYGCSIQDCPGTPDFPFKRGDILISIDGNTIKNQHIKDPVFGKVSLSAAALLSKNEKLSFVLYRNKEKLIVEVEKSLFSQKMTRRQNSPEYIIVDGIVIQPFNSHYFSWLEENPIINPQNQNRVYCSRKHNLKKIDYYIKEENDQILLITETLTNNTLFNSIGSPFSCSFQTPFVIRKFNGNKVRNLEALIEKMALLTVGSAYTILGTQNDVETILSGIKISQQANAQILSQRKIEKSFSAGLKPLAAKLNEASPSISPNKTILYQYLNPDLSTRLPPERQTSDFDIKMALTRGMLYLHSTSKVTSNQIPYHFMADKKGSGSGFIFKYNEKFYIGTCAHVTGFTKEVQVKASFPEYSKDFDLEVIMLNIEHDLAILKVSSKHENEFNSLAHPFCLEESDLFPEAQRDILLLGFPGTSAGDKTNPKIQTGKVTTVGYMSAQGYQRFSNNLFIQINAASSGGNSGGPVINAKTGEVIGILSNGHTAVQLTNLARPVAFLCKMLPFLDEPQIPAYPQLPGIPFTLTSLTDCELKIAHGLDPNCLTGARIDYLLANIPGISSGDILLELIDKNNNAYRVDSKGTIQIQGIDIHYKVFFELQNIGNDISFKILRNGKECIVNTNLDKNWPIHPYVCNSRIDSNIVKYHKFCHKFVLAELDVALLPPKADYSYYLNKYRNVTNGKLTKIILLDYLTKSYNEIAAWTPTDSGITIVNKINGKAVSNIEEVKQLSQDSTIKVFDFEVKRSGMVSTFKITADNIENSPTIKPV